MALFGRRGPEKTQRKASTAENVVNEISGTGVPLAFQEEVRQTRQSHMWVMTRASSHFAALEEIADWSIQEWSRRFPMDGNQVKDLGSRGRQWLKQNGQ